jgi:hypothetical protein
MMEKRERNEDLYTTLHMENQQWQSKAEAKRKEKYEDEVKDCTFRPVISSKPGQRKEVQSRMMAATESSLRRVANLKTPNKDEVV